MEYGWKVSISKSRGIKAPKQHAKKTNEEIERVVVNLRKALMDGTDHESKYLGVGADAIQYRMVKLGFSEDEMPSITINCLRLKEQGDFLRCIIPHILKGLSLHFPKRRRHMPFIISLSAVFTRSTKSASTFGINVLWF